MSVLSVYSVAIPEVPSKMLIDPEDVAATLAAVGVRYERRDIQGGLRPGAAAAEVRAECGELLRDVARELGLSAEEIISLQRGSEQTAELNARFANEQTLAAEHAWLFLAGRGLISLHVGEEVFAFFGERGDLLVVPAGMAHWVSLGEEPHCLAVRLAPEGMAPEETGEAIAGRFFGVEHYC
jgi:1,2-dihydroxy-3-keto-5-methylthiopentene dioxygenase